MSTSQQTDRDAGLIRALGVPGLAANIVNTTIGAGIFVLPASVALLMGAAAPLAFVACALAMGLMVTSFALAGSRVSVTGGIFGYAEAAFGRYFGFMAGALLFINACLGVSSVGAAFTGFVAKLFPVMANEAAKMLLLLVVFAVARSDQHPRGEIGRARRRHRHDRETHPDLHLHRGRLLLHSTGADRVAGLAGWEAAGRISLAARVCLLGNRDRARSERRSEESRAHRPARDFHRARHDNAALHRHPICRARRARVRTCRSTRMRRSRKPRRVFSATAGGLLILVGAIVSAFGFITSDMLSSPRTIFALSSDGIIPQMFARVHPRFRTPYVAIIAYAVITYVLAFSSTFEQLVVLSNVTLLLLYLLGCSSALVLMRRNVRMAGEPLTFPGAFAVPILGLRRDHLDPVACDREGDRIERRLPCRSVGALLLPTRKRALQAPTRPIRPLHNILWRRPCPAPI